MPKIHIRRDRNLAFVLARDPITGKYRKIYLGPVNSREALVKYRELFGSLPMDAVPFRASVNHTLGSAQLIADRKDLHSMLPVTHFITLVDLFSRYIKALLAEPAPDTREISRARRVKQRLSHYYPNITAHTFGAKKLKEFRCRLMEDGYYEDGKHDYYKRDYINRMVKVIRAVYAWGVGEELVEVNDHLAIGPKYVPALREGKCNAPERTHKTREKRKVSDGEIEITLCYLTPMYADIIRLMWLTGMRPGEICNLTWDEITEERIDVKEKGKGGEDVIVKKVLWVYRPKKHKTSYRGKHRCIPFGSRAQAILSKYKGITGYVFTPKTALLESYLERTKNDKKDWSVSLIRIGDQMEPRLISNAVKRAVKRAQKAGKPVKKWVPYHMRSKAYSEIRKEFGPEVAQKFCGHSSQAVGDAYYDLTDEDVVMDLAAKRG